MAEKYTFVHWNSTVLKFEPDITLEQLRKNLKSRKDFPKSNAYLISHDDSTIIYLKGAFILLEGVHYDLSFEEEEALPTAPSSVFTPGFPKNYSSLHSRRPDLVSSQYTNRQLLYPGDLSVVYAVTRTCDHTTVVLKALHGEYAQEEWSIHNFLNAYGGEPHFVVPLLDSFTINTTVILVLPYLVPVSCHTFRFSHISQIFKALNFIHEAGVTHCDIKPSNMMLDLTSSEIRVIDFGLACFSNSIIPKGTGSPRYMAPEVKRGKSIGTACDMWSAAISLIELLVEESHQSHPKDCLSKISDNLQLLFRGLLQEIPYQRLTAKNALKFFQ